MLLLYHDVVVVVVSSFIKLCSKYLSLSQTKSVLNKFSRNPMNSILLIESLTYSNILKWINNIHYTSIAAFK